MKTILLVAFLSFSTWSSRGQNTIGENVRSISVTGTAERILSANQVEISVRIRSDEATLALAREKTDSVFGRLLKDLEELEVKPEDVELRNQELGKDYVNGPDRERVVRGFYSTKSFAIVLGEIGKLEPVHEILAENPDLEVNGTSYSRTDDIEIHKELRVLSLEVAREKAMAMAKVYGQRVGRALKIAEGKSGGFPFPHPNAFETRNTGVTVSVEGVAGGKVTLSTSVSVVFELLD